jgi:hypothetical protein
MVDPNKPCRTGRQLPKEPDAREVLERLRDSYAGLSATDDLTTADKAVLAAVLSALERIAKAG